MGSPWTIGFCVGLLIIISGSVAAVLQKKPLTNWKHTLATANGLKSLMARRMTNEFLW
mgnify:CR=1 FL=1